MTALSAEQMSRWFRRLAWIGVALALVVIVMGAWVRLSAAGLGCPDWPGCYGHFTAGAAEQNLARISQEFARPFEYHKAVKEMVHRYFASTLGLLCVALAALAFANRRDPQQPVTLPTILVALVIFQGLLGMWTVTLLLKPLIVTLHLLGGLATMSLLAWLAMKSPAEPESSISSVRPIRQFALAAFAILILQIFLGGWTSSNYAALACPDFPTCQSSYWPEMNAKDAFVLWRGLGIDYEGGVLDHPARVTIHFAHRVGAVVTALALGCVAWLAWRHGTTMAIKKAGVLVGLVLIAQLILGPVMVIRALPLELATAHNGVAAFLVLSMVRLLRVTQAQRNA